MAVTQYIGSRYVPVFADPSEWSSERQYEPLTIVTYQGDSYTSKKFVPVGIDVLNDDYWVLTGQYNSQINQYREEVRQLSRKLPGEDFDTNATVKDYVDGKVVEIESGVSDSISNIETYVDTQNADTKKYANKLGLFGVLSDPDFYPYTRVVLEDPNSTYTSFQVATIDKTERYIYVVQPFTSSNQLTTKTSTLLVVDAQSGSILARKTMDVGHGRSLSINDKDIMITCNQYAQTNNEWVAIDVSNPVNPILVSRGYFNGQHIFWTPDGICGSYNGTLQFYDVTYDVTGRIPVSITPNEKFIPLVTGIRGEEQSFYYYNDMIVVASTLPEAISFLDYETGELIKTINLRQSYSYLLTQECESAFIVNDNIYFTTNSNLPLTANGTPIKEMSVFRQNLYHQYSALYDPWRKVLYQSSRGGAANVSGSANAASSVSADGSAEYPYRFVQDALHGFTATRRDHYNETTIRPLSVTFTGQSYPYRIVINNPQQLVALNGYAESITECGFIYAGNNAAVILNRLHPMYTENTPISTTAACVILAQACTATILKCVFDNYTGDKSSYFNVIATNGSVVNIGSDNTNLQRLRLNHALGFGTKPTTTSLNGGYFAE